MGCTSRDKHVRPNRRSATSTRPISGAAAARYDFNTHHNSLLQSPPPPNPNPTDDEVEQLLFHNLDLLYNEAISKLVALGYSPDLALKALLRNGHCYGGHDVLSNIVHNCLDYLNKRSNIKNGQEADDEDDDEEEEASEAAFVDLKQLEHYSLAAMVCMLQQVRPGLSKGDAMWILLSSELHVGKATTMEAPNNAAVNESGNVAAAPAEELCRFHGGWGFPEMAAAVEMRLEREIECPKRFNLSPSMKELLKRNVALFAAGFRANSKHKGCGGGGGDVAASGNVEVEESEESQEVGVNSVLSKFRELNLDEDAEAVVGGEERKNEAVVSLLHKVKELEKQVKERKEWAHQKAMQAAKKLSHDLTELKLLRMESEETQRLKKGKQTLEDTTMKRLSEMENALRKASGQVDRANAAVRRLENENAEIRAEMEASKLSAAESANTCLEVAKREKKCLKRLLAWEKQKGKLQEEIGAEKQKILEAQQQLGRIKQEQKEAEVKFKQEMKAKEAASTLVDEERVAKETAEASNKRRLEALRLKIEIDFQRHKDDLRRLEQELSRLKSSAQPAESLILTAPPRGVSAVAKPQGESIAKLLSELDNLESSAEKEFSCDRECMICMKDEVSVVFLPCAHQVLCVNCNDKYGKKGRATCPCCQSAIERRIHVFGASS